MKLQNLNFGDMFLLKNGLRAVYLWSKDKTTHSFMIENDKTPNHYDENGIWYGQTNQENPLDIKCKLR